MNTQIYSLLLTLCPADLRKDFGVEMTQVFLEDLEDHRRSGGWFGAARVWWRSVRELCRIVLPEMASRREVAVPFVMWMLQWVLILFLQLDPRNTSKPAGDLLVLIFIPGIIPAAIVRITQLIGDSSVPDALTLRP